MYNTYWDYITRDYPVLNNLLSQPSRVVNQTRWKMLEPPVGQIVTTAEAKLYMKVENDVEDSLVDGLIKSATFLAERYTSRAILRQKWSQTFDWTPQNDYFELTPSGFTTLDEITSFDKANNESVWDPANYFVDDLDEYSPVRINLNIDAIYPTDLRYRAAFKAKFFSGWADASEVPEEIKTAVMIIAQNLYEDREGVMAENEGTSTGSTNADDGAGGMPKRAKKLLWNYKVIKI